eukprot:g4200.t1
MKRRTKYAAKLHRLRKYDSAGTAPVIRSIDAIAMGGSHAMSGHIHHKMNRKQRERMKRHQREAEAAAVARQDVSSRKEDVSTRTMTRNEDMKKKREEEEKERKRKEFEEQRALRIIQLKKEKDANLNAFEVAQQAARAAKMSAEEATRAAKKVMQAKMDNIPSCDVTFRLKGGLRICLSSTPEKADPSLNLPENYFSYQQLSNVLKNSEMLLTSLLETKRDHSDGVARDFFSYVLNSDFLERRDYNKQHGFSEKDFTDAFVSELQLWLTFRGTLIKNGIPKENSNDSLNAASCEEVLSYFDVRLIPRTKDGARKKCANPTLIACKKCLESSLTNKNKSKLTLSDFMHVFGTSKEPDLDTFWKQDSGADENKLNSKKENMWRNKISIKKVLEGRDRKKEIAMAKKRLAQQIKRQSIAKKFEENETKKRLEKEKLEEEKKKLEEEERRKEKEQERKNLEEKNRRRLLKEQKQKNVRRGRYQSIDIRMPKDLERRLRELFKLADKDHVGYLEPQKIDEMCGENEKSIQKKYPFFYHDIFSEQILVYYLGESSSGLSESEFINMASKELKIVRLFYAIVEDGNDRVTSQEIFDFVRKHPRYQFEITTQIPSISKLKRDPDLSLNRKQFSDVLCHRQVIKGNKLVPAKWKGKHHHHHHHHKKHKKNNDISKKRWKRAQRNTSIISNLISSSSSSTSSESDEDEENAEFARKIEHENALMLHMALRLQATFRGNRVRKQERSRHAALSRFRGLTRKVNEARHAALEKERRKRLEEARAERLRELAAEERKDRLIAIAQKRAEEETKRVEELAALERRKKTEEEAARKRMKALEEKQHRLFLSKLMGWEEGKRRKMAWQRNKVRHTNHEQRMKGLLRLRRHHKGAEWNKEYGRSLLHKKWLEQVSHATKLASYFRGLRCRRKWEKEIEDLRAEKNLQAASLAMQKDEGEVKRVNRRRSLELHAQHLRQEFFGNRSEMNVDYGMLQEMARPPGFGVANKGRSSQKGLKMKVTGNNTWMRRASWKQDNDNLNLKTEAENEEERKSNQFQPIVLAKGDTEWKSKDDERVQSQLVKKNLMSLLSKSELSATEVFSVVPDLVASAIDITGEVLALIQQQGLAVTVQEISKDMPEVCRVAAVIIGNNVEGTNSWCVEILSALVGAHTMSASLAKHKEENELLKDATFDRGIAMMSTFRNSTKAAMIAMMSCGAISFSEELGTEQKNLVMKRWVCVGVASQVAAEWSTSASAASRAAVLAAARVGLAKRGSEFELQILDVYTIILFACLAAITQLRMHKDSSNGAINRATVLDATKSAAKLAVGTFGIIANRIVISRSIGTITNIAFIMVGENKNEDLAKEEWNIFISKSRKN